MLLRTYFSSGIIGTGSLGENIIKMYLNRWPLGLKPLSISGSCRCVVRENQLKSMFASRITLYSDNRTLAAKSDVIFLAVKPSQIKEVCAEISDILHKNTVVISMAAAVPLYKLKEWLPNTNNIVRCMPNVPCSIGQGVVVFYSEFEEAKTIMCNIFEPNTVIAVDSDSQVDAATLISGCGPAFFSWYAACLHKIGADELQPDVLNTMIVETMRGTASLLRTSNYQDVIRSVASPMGATEAALQSFENSSVDTGVIEALNLAQERIKLITSTL
jgi:pyrroline-5-carboxylate reductase